MPLFPTTDADLPAIVALVNSAYRGDSARQGWAHEADYLSGQRTDEASLRASLAAQAEARLLVWRDEPDGNALGCVFLEPAEGSTWYLGMLTVRPDLQARRLGRDLLQAGEDFAAAQGADRIRMTVVNVRGTLIAWYQRRGYALTGERRPFPYDDARFGLPQRDDLSFVVLEKMI
ncbi:MAG: family N-acetyltransferase [Rhizorhabdus sp.]|nr:family N-acetyltransferase [Rhizorhabdus sp.]